MTKRERELAETRVALRQRERELRDMQAATDAAINALKWAREMLVEKEEENRKLKFIIMELTGAGKTDGTDSR